MSSYVKSLPHEILIFSRRATDPPYLPHGGQIQPLVIVMVRIIVLPGKKSSAFHIGRSLKEHDGFAVFTQVHGIGKNASLPARTAVIDQLHGHQGFSVIPVGTLLHLPDDFPAGKLGKEVVLKNSPQRTQAMLIHPMVFVFMIWSPFEFLTERLVNYKARKIKKPDPCS
jgi:hypothetical protein